MRYLVNLPLLGTVLLGWTVIHMGMFSSLPRGGEAGMGTAILIMLAGLVTLVLLTLTVVGSAMTGGFDWLPVVSRGARITIALIGYGALVLLFLLPLGVAIDSLRDLEASPFGSATIWTARVVTLGLPLLVIAYAAWLTNAPDAVRQLPPIRYAALAGMAVLAVAGAVVSMQQLAVWNRESAAEKDAERTEELAKADATRREFTSLTGSEPLLKWYEFTSYGMPEDIREEAMHRIATRPDLDAELIAVLQSDNPNWAGEGVRFVAELVAAPSPALAEAVQRRLNAYAKFLVEDSKVITYDGDKRLDYFEAVRLREALKAARKLAETSRTDLRPQLDALREAVAFYPKSDLAVRYPAEVEETKKQIAAALGAAK